MKHFFARTCRLPLPLSSRVFHPTPTISPKDTFARIPPLVSQHIFHILLTQSARNENGTDLPPEFQESRSFRVCYGVFLPGHPKPLLPPSPSLLPPPFPPCLSRSPSRALCLSVACSSHPTVPHAHMHKIKTRNKQVSYSSDTAAVGREEARLNCLQYRFICMQINERIFVYECIMCDVCACLHVCI